MIFSLPVDQFIMYTGPQLRRHGRGKCSHLRFTYALTISHQFNLAWKLALATKGLAAPSLLTTYTEERLPVIAAMLEKSTLLHDAIQKADDAGWKRGGDLRQLGVNYRWSSVVVDERTPKPRGHQDVNPYGSGTDGSLRAGDRAPEAPGLVLVDDGARTSLFDVFGPGHHTVLLFTPSADLMTEQLLAKMKAYPAGLIKTVEVFPQGTLGPRVVGHWQPDNAVVDQDGHAFAGYQVTPEKPTIVVVRPDGYVGGIVYGLHGVEAYFQSVFATLDTAP